MSKAIIAATLLLSAVYAGSAAAADSAEVKSLVSNVCSKCHGATGVSQSALFPHIAGQQAEYLDAELRLFRGRERGDPHAQAYMWGLAGSLSDAQIAGLAKFFAAKPPAKGTPPADPALAKKGEEIFMNGVTEREIPACMACHGEKAEGNGAIPRLAGQHAGYLFTQLLAFRGLLRDNPTMHENTLQLTDEDAAALAAYLSSL